MRASICDDRNNHYPGTVLECLTEPIAAVIDLRSQNLGTVRTDGFDLSTGFSFDSGAGGTVTGQLDGTYILNFTNTAMPLTPRMNLLNSIGEPVARRLSGSLRWELGPIELAMNVNNTGSYRDTDTGRSVSSLTTLDAAVSFSFGEHLGAILRDSRFAVRVKNAVDRGPPFAISRAMSAGYDAASADPYGRVVSVGVSKTLK
jgi:iron complex outermembrane recepter protein